jgi:hypothetical protein
MVHSDFVAIHRLAAMSATIMAVLLIHTTIVKSTAAEL